jgi:hypothetical protein
MALILTLFCGVARAQEPGAGAGGPPPGVGAGLPPLPSTGPAWPSQVSGPSVAPPTRGVGVRRVQASGNEMQAPPTPAPSTPPNPAAGATTPSTPGETDLTLPKAERPGGGGEPTAAAAEAEKEEAAKEGDAEEAPAKDETKLLMNGLGIPDSPVKIYGWIQNSYTGNTNGVPRNDLNFGVNPNSQANRWMGNQYYLILEKTLTLNDEVNFGFRVDNLFGNDWQFNHMHGLFDTSFKLNHFAGYDPAQMYAEVHLPVLTRGGLDVKGGRWYTLAGYEVVPATGRPLLSVPYMFNYGQPFTHFGALTTLHLTDKINIYNGAINGWDRWIDSHYKWGYIGGISWTFNEDKTSLAVTMVWGPNQFPNFLPANTRVVPTGATPPPFLAGRRNLGYGANDRTLFTTVLTHKWSDKLTQVIETDQAIEKNVPGTGPGGTNQDAEWYSFGNWFLYQFNEKVMGVWRSEIFRDNNGVRTGVATNYSEFTLGAQYKPKPWLWIRPEARYDFARSGHPYSDGTRNSQLTLAFDVILLY